MLQANGDLHLAIDSRAALSGGTPESFTVVLDNQTILAGYKRFKVLSCWLPNSFYTTAASNCSLHFHDGAADRVAVLTPQSYQSISALCLDLQNTMDALSGGSNWSVAYNIQTYKVTFQYSGPFTINWNVETDLLSIGFVVTGAYASVANELVSPAAAIIDQRTSYVLLQSSALRSICQSHTWAVYSDNTPNHYYDTIKKLVLINGSGYENIDNDTSNAYWNYLSEGYQPPAYLDFRLSWPSSIPTMSLNGNNWNLTLLFTKH